MCGKGKFEQWSYVDKSVLYFNVGILLLVSYLYRFVKDLRRNRIVSHRNSIFISKLVSFCEHVWLVTLTCARQQTNTPNTRIISQSYSYSLLGYIQALLACSAVFLQNSLGSQTWVNLLRKSQFSVSTSLTFIWIFAFTSFWRTTRKHVLSTLGKVARLDML